MMLKALHICDLIPRLRARAGNSISLVRLSDRAWRSRDQARFRDLRELSEEKVDMSSEHIRSRESL